MGELYNAIPDADTKIQKIGLDKMKRPSGIPHSIKDEIAIDSSKYQLMPEDFSTNPVTILQTDPTINISTFFDKLVKTHNNRNFFNQL